VFFKNQWKNMVPDVFFKNQWKNMVSDVFFKNQWKSMVPDVFFNNKLGKHGVCYVFQQSIGKTWQKTLKQAGGKFI